MKRILAILFTLICNIYMCGSAFASKVHEDVYWDSIIQKNKNVLIAIGEAHSISKNLHIYNYVLDAISAKHELNLLLYEDGYSRVNLMNNYMTRECVVSYGILKEFSTPYELQLLKLLRSYYVNQLKGKKLKIRGIDIDHPADRTLTVYALDLLAPSYSSSDTMVNRFVSDIKRHASLKVSNGAKAILLDDFYNSLMQNRRAYLTYYGNNFPELLNVISFYHKSLKLQSHRFAKATDPEIITAREVIIAENVRIILGQEESTLSLLIGGMAHIGKRNYLCNEMDPSINSYISLLYKEDSFQPKIQIISAVIFYNRKRLSCLQKNEFMYLRNIVKTRKSETNSSVIWISSNEFQDHEVKMNIDYFIVCLNPGKNLLLFRFIQLIMK